MESLPIPGEQKSVGTGDQWEAGEEGRETALRLMCKRSAFLI